MKRAEQELSRVKYSYKSTAIEIIGDDVWDCFRGVKMITDYQANKLREHLGDDVRFMASVKSGLPVVCIKRTDKDRPSDTDIVGYDVEGDEIGKINLQIIEKFGKFYWSTEDYYSSGRIWSEIPKKLYKAIKKYEKKRKKK